MNRCLLFVALVTVFGLGMTGHETARAGDLVPPHIVDQLGLEEAWKRYVSVPAGAQSIAHQEFYVHSEKSREYAEIRIQMPDQAAGTQNPETRVLVRIPTDRLGLDGMPIGKKEAERLATNEMRRLKRRGFEPTLEWNLVPRIHLYTLGNDGTLEARDAETGELIWMTRVGDRVLKYNAFGVGEDYITVINGSRMIQVDVNDGEVLEEVRTMGTPLHGAVHAGRFSMIPTIKSGVEGYPMYDPTLDPFMEVVAGLALERPTVATDKDSTRAAWGTDRGFVYVMEMSGEPSVLFRLNTDGIVSGRIATAAGNRFFFGSEAGQVYAIRATRTGVVLWSRPYAEPFYDGPMVVGDKLLIRSTYGNLHCLQTEDGYGAWDRPLPNVDKLIGALGDAIFYRTMSGSLSVLNLNNGDVIRSFGEVNPGKLLVNNLTDRLYFVSASGAVQCLRPKGADMPTFRVQPDVQPIEEEKGNMPPPTNDTPFGEEPEDPFGAGEGMNDPFGDGGGNDPFGDGGGNDPFGGGEMEDPFGPDPFGGN